MGAINRRFQLWAGLVIGGAFVVLALWKVDFGQMGAAFKAINGWYLFPAVAVILFSSLMRAWRWQYLLDPIMKVNVGSLFSSLVIGYMANALMPAHLGEFLRAYVLSKKEGVAASSAFATIVMERIIDVFALLGLMAFAVFLAPFPGWVKSSGYLMFGATGALFIILILFKRMNGRMRCYLAFILRPLPQRLQQKAEVIFERFLSGIVPLKNRRDYVNVAFLSLVIWACYGAAFYFLLLSFDFAAAYGVPWYASLVILVITTVSVVIPSSPGYVGTYHYLGQVSLALYQVPASPALSFATVAHAVNMLPVCLLGLFFSYREGIGVLRMSTRITENS